MNTLIDFARHIPTPEAALTVAYTSILLPMKDRQPLDLRLTAPAEGRDIPIVLFSHGGGPSNYIPSKDGYAHLTQFWAERGLAVIQPTHATSRVGGLPPDAEGAPFFWRERVAEMTAILDRLDEIEAKAPAIAGGWIAPASRRRAIPLAAIPPASFSAAAFRVRIFATRAFLPGSC
ncbi:alpha/beta hydrolase [Mameliella alba]|uniref:hypothetical protein n=1 Tax=Mameliella alba TaxID=561184 RepID=UPI0021BD60E5|nr:hypothetical protein [Mameliella alba]